MSRTYFIPGQQPSTGGTGEKRSYPTQEQLERRHPEFYKNRPEQMTSAFAAPGDRVRIHGDEAEVKHVEKNSDGSQDVTLQRSARGDSGTYVAKIEPAPNRQQRIRKLKRTFE